MEVFFAYPKGKKRNVTSHATIVNVSSLYRTQTVAIIIIIIIIIAKINI